jgi:hypothetical protein
MRFEIEAEKYAIAGQSGDYHMRSALAKRGKEGWELVTVFPVDEHHHFAYFKRPRPDLELKVPE